jgi:DNA polymerase III epsilon subunit-like protein
MIRDFAAIDFETANYVPGSVCSIGVVTVRDGMITERFYELINNHQLHTVTAHCGCDLTHHHRALDDTEACAFIALQIL